MKITEFDYDLNEKLIAKTPEEERDESKLMVIHRESGTIEHKKFKDVLDYFEPEDLMVFNDTKVFPARIFGYKEKTSAKIEVFLLRELNPEMKLWDVLVDPARKIRIGNKIIFGEDHSLVAEIIDNTTSRGRTLRFFYDGTYEEYREKINELGETPLPRYIKRPPNEEDLVRYQTIYADKEGAVAAPTAGLHFSRHVMKRMEIKGIESTFLTLHVGIGTFMPINVDDVKKFKMNAEEIIIDKQCVDIINKKLGENRKICAVGTTVVRALESSVSSLDKLKTSHGWTNKFIYPGHEFKIPNALITNFHMPKSTLMALVCAFADTKLIKKAYKEAQQKKYRFLSYGDAMLIL